MENMLFNSYYKNYLKNCYILSILKYIKYLISFIKKLLTNNSFFL